MKRHTASASGILKWPLPELPAAKFLKSGSVLEHASKHLKSISIRGTQWRSACIHIPTQTHLSPGTPWESMQSHSDANILTQLYKQIFAFWNHWYGFQQMKSTAFKGPPFDIMKPPCGMGERVVWKCIFCLVSPYIIHNNVSSFQPHALLLFQYHAKRIHVISSPPHCKALNLTATHSGHWLTSAYHHWGEKCTAFTGDMGENPFWYSQCNLGEWLPLRKTLLLLSPAVFLEILSHFPPVNELFTKDHTSSTENTFRWCKIKVGEFQRLLGVTVIIFSWCTEGLGHMQTCKLFSHGASWKKERSCWGPPVLLANINFSNSHNIQCILCPQATNITSSNILLDTPSQPTDFSGLAHILLPDTPNQFTEFSGLERVTDFFCSSACIMCWCMKSPRKLASRLSKS